VGLTSAKNCNSTTNASLYKTNAQSLVAVGAGSVTVGPLFNGATLIDKLASPPAIILLS